MADLSGLVIKSNRKGILNLGSVANTPLSTTLQNITDGLGNNSPLQLATDRIAITSLTEYSWVSPPTGVASKTSLYFDSNGRMGIKVGTGFIATFGTQAITANRNYMFPDATTTLAGLAVSNNNFTGRITMGTTTGTALLCFPDAGTTANDGIQFGSGSANLYRSGVNILKSDAFWIKSAPSLTGSMTTSALNITQTLNTTGSPDVINLDVTNTASGSSTNLLNLKVGGVSVFRVLRSGGINVGGASVFNSSVTFANILDTSSTQNFRIAIPSANRTLLVNHDYGNSASASAIMELQTTTQGMLVPQMTTTQVNAIVSPKIGLLVFNTTLETHCQYTTSGWVKLSHSAM